MRENRLAEKSIRNRTSPVCTGIKTRDSLRLRLISTSTSCLQSAAHTTRYWDYSLQKSLSILLSGSNFYVTKTVNELMFIGYPDTVLSMGKMMASDVDMPPYDRFAWFYMVRSPTRLVTFFLLYGESFYPRTAKNYSRHPRAMCQMYTHHPRGHRFYDQPFALS